MRSPRVDDGSAPRSASAPPWHIRARRPCRQRPLALRTRIWPASPMGRTRPPTPATCPPGSAWIPQWRSSCRCSAPASRGRNPPTPCPRHRPTAPASGPGPSARRPSAGVRKSPVPLQGRSARREGPRCAVTARDWPSCSSFRVPVAKSIIPVVIRCASGSDDGSTHPVRFRRFWHPRPVVQGSSATSRRICPSNPFYCESGQKHEGPRLR